MLNCTPRDFYPFSCPVKTQIGPSNLTKKANGRNRLRDKSGTAPTGGWTEPWGRQRVEGRRPSKVVTSGGSPSDILLEHKCPTESSGQKPGSGMVTVLVQQSPMQTVGRPGGLLGILSGSGGLEAEVQRESPPPPPLEAHRGDGAQRQE